VRWPCNGFLFCRPPPLVPADQKPTSVAVYRLSDGRSLGFLREYPRVTSGPSTRCDNSGSRTTGKTAYRHWRWVSFDLGLPSIVQDRPAEGTFRCPAERLRCRHLGRRRQGGDTVGRHGRWCPAAMLAEPGRATLLPTWTAPTVGHLRSPADRPPSCLGRVAGCRRRLGPQSARFPCGRDRLSGRPLLASGSLVAGVLRVHSPDDYDQASQHQQDGGGQPLTPLAGPDRKTDRMACG
jgi:hypothetical protein